MINRDLYYDNRGYVGKLIEDNGKYKEHRICKTIHGAIRGFHGDAFTEKVIFCLWGRVQLILFCPTTLERIEYLLDPKSQGIVVPKGWLNGHQALEDSLIYYPWTEPYKGPENQWSIYFNDKTISPKWILPIDLSLISERDKTAKTFNEQINTFR